MKYVFTLLSFLIIKCASADKFENVEYHLPKIAAKWIGGSEGNQAMFVPSNEVLNERFLINIHRKSIVTSDAMKTIAHLELTNKMNLNNRYPFMDIDLRILSFKKTEISCEYVIEAIVRENGVEKHRSIERIVSNKDSTVFVIYETEDNANIKAVRSIWLQAIMEVKLLP